MPNKKILVSFLTLILLMGGLFVYTTQAKAAVATRDVVINEIMWGGSSTSSVDQWIELRNASDTAIDIGDWTITNAKNNTAFTATTTDGTCSTTTIAAYGYFLISNLPTASSSINVTPQCTSNATTATTLSLNTNYLLNGALQLKRGATIIDETSASSTVAWPAGASTTLSSMARDFTIGLGTSTDSWHTAIIATNWDGGAAAPEKGTPGSYNGYPVTGTVNQLNADASGTVYIVAQKHTDHSTVATYGRNATGTYDMYLFASTTVGANYDFFAFRDSNATLTQYNAGIEPAQTLNNNGVGYGLGVTGLSGINFSMAINPVITGITPTSTNIGSSITITGNYFGNSTTTSQGTITIPQNIDGTAYVTSWSSTSIAVTIPPTVSPPGPQTGQLTLTLGWTQPAATTLTIKPKVLSAAATQNTVTINFDSYIDGGPASTLSNYTLTSPAGNTVSLGSAFSDFRGNKVFIKGINLTTDNYFSIVAGSNITSMSGTAIDASGNSATGTVAAGPTITSISPNSRAVGATTTITGTNFGAATGTVYFNPGPPTGGAPPQPAAASTTSWSATQIVAVVPSGAKSGPVSLRTSTGAESDFSPSAYFDVPATLTYQVLERNTGTPISSSTAKIIIGKQGGPALYYHGVNNTTFSNGTTTITSAPSMGYTWAFDSSGNHVAAAGQEVNLSTTTVFNLATSTTKISGTIIGASANAMLAIFADPIVESGTGMQKGGEPMFIVTNASGTASFSIGLSATGTYIVGINDPGFGGGASSSPKLAPATQQVNASTTTAVTGLTFTFTSASARIHGKVEKATGNFNTGPGIDAFHVMAYQPIENGLNASAMIDSNGEFDLYVAPGTFQVEVGGPDLPSPVRKQVEIKSGDTNFALTNAVTDVTLVIKAPTEYITGQVKDSNGNAVSGASIFAWSTSGPGGGQASADSNGYYKLYVSAGTYTVEGFAPQYGKLTARSGVVVASNSSTTVDFSVSSEVATISGTVVKNSASTSYMEVWVTQGATGYRVNGTKTGSDGTYSFTVPYASGYYLHVGQPGKGEVYKEALATFNSGNTSTSSVISINTANIAVRISPVTAFTDAFVEAYNASNTSQRGFSNKDVSTDSSYREYVLEVPRPTGDIPSTYIIQGGIPNFGPLTPTNTTIASTTTSATKTITLGSAWQVSGTIADPDLSTVDNEAADAFIWAASSAGHGGGQVNASGTFSFSLKEGTYDFGIDKKNYAGTMVSNIAVTSATTVTGLSLSSANLHIAGQVTKSGAAETGAWVWATNGSGGWSGDQTDGSGNYNLKVTAGTWSVKAASEGYEGTSQSVEISSGTSTVNIGLSAMSGYTSVAPTMESFVPKNGGVVQGDNVKFEAPAGALSSQDSNTGRVSIQKTTSVPSTNGVKPLGDAAYDITAYNASGTAFTTLNDSVTITLTYASNTITAAGLTQAQAANLSLGYWDSTTNTWVTISTNAATSTDGSVTYTGTTNHLSSYAPLLSSGANPPPTPTNLTATAGNQQIVLSWTASSGATKYDIYRKSGSLYPYLAQTTGTSYTDSGLTNGITYYYKISALNAGDDESTSTDAVSATPVTPTSPPGGGGGGGGTVTTVTVPHTTTGQVTATAEAGGKTTLTTTENIKATVELPANAVSANTTVTVAPIAKTTSAVTAAVSAMPAGKSIVGTNVYNYTATTIAGTTVSSFSTAVTLTFTYSDAQIAGLQESTLKVHYWAPASSTWAALTTTVNTTTNTLTCTTTHFTYFAILGEAAAVVTPTPTPSATPTAATTTPAVTKPISQMTIAELQAEITRITNLILQLQIELAKLVAAPTTITGIVGGIPADFTFKASLKLGMVSNEVKYLQIVLNSASDTKLAESGPGSSGNETTRFGGLTKAAVIKFQEKYASETLTPWGLSQGTGIVGSKTILKLNAILGK